MHSMHCILEVLKSKSETCDHGQNISWAFGALVRRGKKEKNVTKFCWAFGVRRGEEGTQRPPAAPLVSLQCPANISLTCSLYIQLYL